MHYSVKGRLKAEKSDDDHITLAVISVIPKLFGISRRIGLVFF